ncbi:MAG: SRPBCC domain-containing protein [Pseudomonadota bacterium]
MSSIRWPEGFIPGKTDNFVSNEIIVSDLSAADVWPFLNDTSHWSSYYSNVADIKLSEPAQTELYQGAEFRFTTFGFPIEAVVREHVAPSEDGVGRMAWHGWSGEAEAKIDAYHAWLFEDLSDDRVRILTQETQKGGPARELAKTLPNPMLNAHQEWIDGLAKTALHHKTSG